MAGQKLWGSIKPYDNTMLHVAPVLPSDDCPSASCYDALGEGHQLLQFKGNFNKDEKGKEGELTMNRKPADKSDHVLSTACGRCFSLPFLGREVYLWET